MQPRGGMVRQVKQPRTVIVFGDRMMGSGEHLDVLVRLIGPDVTVLDDYIPAPPDPAQLTMDVLVGVTPDMEEVVVFRYSMDLSRLAVYDGPATYRRFRVTPGGPILLTHEERSRDQMAELRFRGRAGARARIAAEYGDDWYRQVRQIVRSGDALRCPLCSTPRRSPRLSLLKTD